MTNFYKDKLVVSNKKNEKQLTISAEDLRQEYNSSY